MRSASRVDAHEDEGATRVTRVFSSLTCSAQQLMIATGGVRKRDSNRDIGNV